MAMSTRTLADRSALLSAVRGYVTENPWAHLVLARVYHERPDVDVMEVPQTLQLTALGHTGWDMLSQELTPKADVVQRTDTRAAVLWHVHAGIAIRWFFAEGAA